jgi:hypothetical protein
MRSRYCVVGILIGMAGMGCGRHPSAKVAVSPAAKPAAHVSVPLPDWAPKDPSLEFLRAAKVLKPMPTETFHSATQSDPAAQAFMDRYARTLPAAWELFGSLTDEQVQRFLTAKPDTDNPEIAKLILIPVKSLTPGQRGALDRWFEAWRTAMRDLAGSAEEKVEDDRLVTLYKAGAKRDLSNLDVGFNQAGHSVNLTFQIRRPDKNMRGFGCTIGTL